MFEVTGKEIQQLDDKQLRTLVARLAVAELLSLGQPISGVTAGGDQNAPDGGLDVRVEVPAAGFKGDFVPRAVTGFQVKKSDMAPAAIATEMKPKGALRPVLKDLADAGGSYIIVSSSGSVADKPLNDRRNAIKAAFDGQSVSAKVHSDFYDRDRVANWVNCFPGVVAWVKDCIGRSLSGWQSLGDWSGIRIVGDGKYIVDNEACLVDARSIEQVELPIIEGIERIRDALSKPGQCVRLIGMSGLGKTRLVQALFESEVGERALDPSLAVYTDYSETPNPTAKQLVLNLIATGQRAIVVVDNCNPQTHSELAEICSNNTEVSIITVEYDVRDDEPEGTKVFRLKPASKSTITEWLKASFDHISQVDRGRIAEFSSGNFRLARVLADTLKQGETLGNLKDRELFRRIFQQRNEHSDDLLSAAEALALVFSFHGADTHMASELSMLAPIAKTDASSLYAHVTELKKRDLVQSRGHWRALLPHAIANRLASQALERVPSNELDSFCAKLSPRMQKSLTRRLGYLHDNIVAKQTVARWLRSDGPLGNLFVMEDQPLQLLSNIAPVAPETVLLLVEEVVVGSLGSAMLNPKADSRWMMTKVLKSLAYDPALFDRAAMLLGKFVAAEAPEEMHNSARESFEELFQIYLSGTHAPPEQRRELISDLYASSNPEQVRCGHLALRAMLKSDVFGSSSSFEFGARPRNFGWLPANEGDKWSWYINGINLAVELAATSSLRLEIRRIVSASLRGILGVEVCLLAVEAAASEFLKDGEWIEGWLAVRGSIGFDGKGWRPEVLKRVRTLEARLRPADPLNIARAYVMERLGSGFDIVDGDEEDGAERDYSAAYERLKKKAEAIGKDFGDQKELLDPFISEALQSNNAPRAFSFGIGLAESKMSLRDTWHTLYKTFVGLPAERRNATILGGFLCKLNELDSLLGSELLEEILADPEMAPYFVYLQARAEMNEEAISRLRRAISSKRVPASSFSELACGVIRPAPQAALATMLIDLCELDGGTAVAVDIFHMATHGHSEEGLKVEDILLETGHELLLRLDYKDAQGLDAYSIQQTIKESYFGPERAASARELCHLIKMQTKGREVYASHLDYAVEALFEAQPAVALDEFLQDGTSEDVPVFWERRITRRSPLEKARPLSLWSWADQNPATRYPLLSRYLDVFATKNFDDDDGLSPLFLEALERAPDKLTFLKGKFVRSRSSGWSGDSAEVLDKRCMDLEVLKDNPNCNVRSWAEGQVRKLRQRADEVRKRETESEGSFE